MTAFAKHPLAPERTNVLKHKAHIGPRYSQPEMPVTVETFEPITPGEAPSLAPNYRRGSLPFRGQSSTGQTIIGVHLSNGVEFRKVSASKETLKVSTGTLVLRKINRKDRSAWIGEFIPFGEKHGIVISEVPLIKGERTNAKGDAKDLLISRATMAHLSSIY